MFIVYAPNHQIVKEKDALIKRFSDKGRVVFRNAPSYNGEIEDCDGIAVLGDFPLIVDAYTKANIPVEKNKPPRKQRADISFGNENE